MAFDYEANVHLVYFSEKLRKNSVFQRNTAVTLLLSKYMVATLEKGKNLWKE